MTELVPPAAEPIALATALDPTTARRLPSEQPQPRRTESTPDLGLAALAALRASFMRPL